MELLDAFVSVRHVPWLFESHDHNKANDPMSACVHTCMELCMVYYIFIFIIIQVHHVTCTLGLLFHVAPWIKTENR